MSAQYPLSKGIQLCIIELIKTCREAGLKNGSFITLKPLDVAVFNMQAQLIVRYKKAVDIYNIDSDYEIKYEYSEHD